ncbi:acyltransferase [Rhodocyclaceae bacterium SMB388]
MRKITPVQIGCFMLLLALALALGVGTTALVFGGLPLGDFRGVFLVFAALVLIQVWALVVYRAFLRVWPLVPGDIEAGSRQEFIYHVYVLFYLLVFYPVMRSGFMPAPLMRAYYLALGARLGDNTYSQGIIHDPPFVRIGANSVVGQSALLIPHVIEGQRLGHYPIRIGDRVTIGANAVVLSDVVIGDGAIVATSALVVKGTRIGSGEVWAGVPARRIRGGEG